MAQHQIENLESYMYFESTLKSKIVVCSLCHNVMPEAIYNLYL
jgi:hypothetical protein